MGDPAGNLKGTLVLLEIDSGILIGQNALDYNKVSTMIETSAKTTGNHATFVSGRISSTLSVAGIAGTNKESTLKGYAELDSIQEAGTPVTATFTEYTTEAGTTEASGAEKISVSVLISNLSWSSPDNATNTFSCDLQVTGAPTRSTTT